MHGHFHFRYLNLTVNCSNHKHAGLASMFIKSKISPCQKKCLRRKRKSQTSVTSFYPLYAHLTHGRNSLQKEGMKLGI
jgi:hypothetical protein